jgi:hypothetical protein
MKALRLVGLRALACVSITLLGLIISGCGFERLQPTLPDAIPGFTFQDLKSIQDDSSLTTDEKRERIREATGAPDDENGDRLVDFLLNFQVP